MAAPTWVSGGSARSASASSLAPSIPTGSVGDALYLVCYMTRGGSGTQTWNTPAGWVAKGTASSAGQGFTAVFERVADGTEGATVTVTVNGTPAVICAAAVARVTGNNTTTPTDAIQLATPTIASSISAPAITTTGVDRLVLRAFLGGNSSTVVTWTTATSHTEVQDANEIAFDTIVQTTAGTNAAASSTVSSLCSVGAVSIAIAPGLATQTLDGGGAQSKTAPGGGDLTPSGSATLAGAGAAALTGAGAGAVVASGSVTVGGAGAVSQATAGAGALVASGSIVIGGGGAQVATGAGRGDLSHPATVGAGGQLPLVGAGQ